jgi:UDP-N-acetylmuramyl pentapeptide phosphotransferase/UDP-N-acetylglucosamine-1-phosphate transferase
MLGEVLIGGMASLLICMFLGPRFIEYLRVKEFGQHMREVGPAGHHGKAGTPTMGGLAIFLAVSVPFLILSDYRAVSLAVFAVVREGLYSYSLLMLAPLNADLNGWEILSSSVPATAAR